MNICGYDNRDYIYKKFPETLFHIDEKNVLLKLLFCLVNRLNNTLGLIDTEYKQYIDDENDQNLSDCTLICYNKNFKTFQIKLNSNNTTGYNIYIDETYKCTYYTNYLRSIDHPPIELKKLASEMLNIFNYSLLHIHDHYMISAFSIKDYNIISDPYVITCFKYKDDIVNNKVIIDKFKHSKSTYL